MRSELEGRWRRCSGASTLSTDRPVPPDGLRGDDLARLADSGLPVAFLQLGAGASTIPGISSAICVVRPGELDARRLASFVAASDIFLTPFLDGVSTRRGSFMAGLQQGVALVGTSGALTDPMLRASDLELVEVGDAESFADRVALLAADRGRRELAAGRGRRLFEAEFTWDAIADRFLEGVGKR